MKRTLVILLAAGVAVVVASVLFSNHQAARRAAQQAAWQKATAERKAELERARHPPSPVVAAPPAPVAPEPPSAEPSVTSAARPSQSPPVKSSPPIAAQATSATPTANANPVRRAKPELQDPLARQALLAVGFDDAAEEYWLEAINDPDLPANERQDLIEDLNEEGFPDPKNLTPEDLPLIVSRLEIIEAYAGGAMDEVNADAFMEAYKDLVNMYDRVSQK